MKYKVKVLGVQGINNKVYGPGEIVTEKNFPEGNAKKLATEGRIEAVTEITGKEVKTGEEAKKVEIKKAKKV